MSQLDPCLRRFCIPVQPYMLKSDYMYLPAMFWDRCLQKLPEKVALYVRNGDTYIVQFCAEKLCLIGVQLLFKRYNLRSMSYLMFVYLGGFEFSVSVIDLSAVEVLYPEKAVHLSYDFVSTNSIPNLLAFDCGSGFSLEDKMNSALMDYNAKDNCCLKIEINMADQQLSSIRKSVILRETYNSLTDMWVDGNHILLTISDRSWTILVEKKGRELFLSNGWEVFAEEVGLCIDDLVVLTMEKHVLCFSVTILKDYSAADFSNIAGAQGPRQFVKFVSDEFVRSGEFVVPRVMWGKFSLEVEEAFDVVIFDTIKLRCNYCPMEHKVSGLKDLLSWQAFAGVYVLLFEVLSNDRVSLTLFNHTYMSVFM